MNNMRNFLLGVVFALMGANGIAQPALADCVNEAHVVICPIATPEGDLVTHGTIEQNLTHWVEICYPAEDWGSQLLRRGQQPFYVSLNVAGNEGLGTGIRRYQTYEDMVDAKLIQTQCYRQYYSPGWVVMTVTKCRLEGFYVFLTTDVLTYAHHGSRVYFEGRPELDRYAYRVR